MTTIYIRTYELGLDYKNRNLLSRAGEIVSEAFIKNNLHGRILFEQQEVSGTFKVWAYPNEYIPEIDKVLMSLSKPKRPRLNGKVNG